jgi:hypothetical protein
MKILDTKPFSSPITVNPGDTLRVIWRDSEDQVVGMETKIKEAQTLDTAVLVNYDPDEARGLGFEEALGVFAGEAIDEDTC